MSDTPYVKMHQRRGLSGYKWAGLALVLSGLVLLPIVAVAWLSLFPSEPIWGHLWSTSLPRYLRNTVILTLGVGVLTAIIGAGTAWLVTFYRFPGREWLQWALFLPLAIPAYVGAYALVDFLEYAGPVQTAIRSVMGYSNASEYWFPEIRSRWAAILVMSGALFPYVYLLARAAFREHSSRYFEVARALGTGPWARFWRVGLPLARPAIAVGTAIAMMETVADFGVVEYFAVQTLTTGIFSQWLEAGNAGGAAQIAMVILVFVVVLVGLERIARQKSRYHRAGQAANLIAPQSLPSGAGWLAAVACFLPFGFGFVLPASVMLGHALEARAAWVDPDLFRALWHTIAVGSAAAGLTVGSALLMIYGVRQARSLNLERLMPLTTVGYAAPGAVLGLGVLLPVAVFDNALADTILNMTGYDPGLLLTGTAAALVYAYCVRFFAIAQGAIEGAFGRISPNLPLAARTLGSSHSGVLRRVILPLIRGSAGTALLLVFVDCVKELPATLLLRPFNYNTLSTRVYEKASLEQLAQAAPAALMISAVGLLAVLLLARTNR